MEIPSIKSYGNYKNDNYGVHALSVRLGQITLYFSYDTVIAYEDYQDGLVVRENDWSTTTGKHLNFLDGGDKKSRKSATEFHQMLQAALGRHMIDSKVEDIA